MTHALGPQSHTFHGGPASRPLQQTPARLARGAKAGLAAGLVAALAAAASGCAASRSGELAAVDKVDIERFMGDWYVIANIPSFVEKGAHNAVETYQLAAGGRIETTFTFRKGGFDGPLKQYNPIGFVGDDPSNAVWDMQFIWPFKADYRIVYLDESYSTTIVGRNKRDYVWLMAREPNMDDETYLAMLGRIEAMGYDRGEVQRVPQQWP